MHSVRGQENKIPDVLSCPTVDEHLPSEAIPVNQVIPNDIVFNYQRDDEFVRMVCSLPQFKTKQKNGSSALQDLLSIWDPLHAEQNSWPISI